MSPLTTSLQGLLLPPLPQIKVRLRTEVTLLLLLFGHTYVSFRPITSVHSLRWTSEVGTGTSSSVPVVDSFGPVPAPLSVVYTNGGVGSDLGG